MSEPAIAELEADHDTHTTPDVWMETCKECRYEQISILRSLIDAADEHRADLESELRDALALDDPTQS